MSISNEALTPIAATAAAPRPGQTRRTVLTGASLAAFAAALPFGSAAAATGGTLTVAVHVSLAPTWFEPAGTPGIVTPYLVLYALHDGLIKPMPAGLLTPSLAESVTPAADGLSYDFVLRKGIKFHNGDPVTPEDVKFSFGRYRGAGHSLMAERVAGIEISGPNSIRFKLHEPWPDFLNTYGTATSAGWIVPRKYVEKVGDEAFKQAPIGAGPYKFVSFTPGVALVLEAFDGYWRKKPAIKRIVMKVIPDETTRLVALKRGEVDISYSIRGELAQEVQQTPGLKLKPTVGSTPFWMYFTEQWDPKSPWHDVRVRHAARYAIDYDGINKALALGLSHITGSVMPENFEFYKAMPKPKYDPAKAQQMLAAAGYPNGFDAGFYTCDGSYANLGEVIINNLAQVGIKTKLRPLERAAFFAGYSQKKFKGIVQGASGAFGNVATRMEEFVVKGGAYVYGSYPDIDALFPLQAREMNRPKRQQILHKMQDLLDAHAIYAPIWQPAFISAVGPRVGVSGFGLIDHYVYTGPYEDMTLAPGA